MNRRPYLGEHQYGRIQRFGFSPVTGLYDNISDWEGVRASLIAAYSEHPTIEGVWSNAEYTETLVDWAAGTGPHHNDRQPTTSRGAGSCRNGITTDAESHADPAPSLRVEQTFACLPGFAI